MSDATVEIPVELGVRRYAVVVGAGVLQELGPRLAALGLGGRAALVTSERVGALYGAAAAASLGAAGFTPLVVTLPDGEETKTVAWLSLVWDRLLGAGVERGTAVVALGGGVVSDLAGFAAATLLRGLPFAAVPTTLLAQVDAAIGGKTGVDHPTGKNLIGAFHQPRLVLADVRCLTTLPRRELVAGLAEVVKYGAIGDAALFAALEASVERVVDADETMLAPLVAACARQKAAVVGADEREERGERAVLNFGHTVGHALEAVTGYRALLHGEAVAIGMVAAARVSARLGCCAGDAGARLVRLLKRAGLPTEIPNGIDRAALAHAMRADKKAARGRVRFVCLEAIGRTRLVELAPQEIVSHLCR